MNLRRTTARLALAGVSTALAAGSLVAATGVAADAAEAANDYTCSAPADAYVSDFAITVTGGLPVPQFYAGAPVPAGMVRVTVTSQLTSDQALALTGFGITGAHSTDFALGFGSASVPLPIDGDFTQDAGTTTWKASGANQAFTTPGPGPQDIVLPSSFTMITKNAGGDFIPLSCVVKSGETPQTLVADYPLAKQLSKTSLKARNGRKPSIAVTVASTSWGPTVPAGKVVAKEGKKIVGTASLKKGGAVVALTKKLKPGKHKIAVAYVGTKSIKGSSAKVIVTKKR
jgi:hypothetical protein